MSDKSERALQVLLDDWARQKSPLDIAQVERVVSRRGLTPAEYLNLYISLQERNALDGGPKDASVSLEGPPEDLDDYVDDESSEPPTVDGAPRNSERETSAEEDFPREFAFADHDLLTHDQEIELGRAIRVGAKLTRALADKSITKTDQVAALISRAYEAKERLILCNIRLVIRVAYPYSSLSTLDLDDLLQEGIIGLMKAADKYDPELGYKFSTYATWWIRQRIMRAMTDLGTTIRFPVHVEENLRKLRKAIKVLSRFNDGHRPSLRQLEDELHWPKEQLHFFLDLLSQRYVPIDRPKDDDDGPSIGDTLPSADPSPADIVMEIDRAKIVRRALSGLTEKQRKVLWLRFGLDGRGRRTLQQIGDVFGLTRERVRQIEAQGIKNLRRDLRYWWLDENAEVTSNG